MEDNSASENLKAGAEATGKAAKPVNISVTDGEAKREIRTEFHTPTILEELKKLAAGCSVKISIEDPDGKGRTLVDTVPRDEAMAAVSASIIPDDAIEGELKRCMRTIIDHSNLCAVEVSAVIRKDGGDLVGGFCITGGACSSFQCRELMNAVDANAREFEKTVGLTKPSELPVIGG